MMGAEQKPKMIETQMQELSPVISELLRAGGGVRITVTGNSMFPMLRDRKDSVVLAAPGKVGRFDLPLYRRDGGQFVLHRVMRVKKGVYSMCGDNQTALETPIREDQLLAVAVEFCRNGRTISCKNPLYRLYAALWGILRPWRPGIMRAYLAFRRKWSKRRGNR